MTETVDDWLNDPSQSLAPEGGSRKAPDRPIPPTQEQLRDELKNAPEAPQQEKDNGRNDGNGSGSQREDRRGASADGTGQASDPPRGRRRGRAHGEIFDDCPVTPLGVYGDLSFYLDVQGQLRSVDNHTLQKMLHLFGGRAGLLSQKFPSYDKDGDPVPGKFNQMHLSTAMVAATHERGVWSPTGRVRGAGCWTDDDGQLIFHAGDQVLLDGEWKAPGVYDGKVYSASDKVPRPAVEIGRLDPAGELLQLIGSWNWRRPDVDPMLALGAICAQMIGGALDWRPVTWLTGDQATGKSTFQKLLKNVHGGSDGLLQASDATEAGIRSVIGFSSLPVALDELEPDDDPKKGKAQAIIRLARIAASGDQILRGSTDQKGYQGNAYSCFIFSSILVPPLPPQDRSRLIMLDLNQLDAGAKKVEPDMRRIRRLGAGLRKRLMDGWDIWHERLETWRAALAKAGHGGRHADNYGTVLALADMAISPEPPKQSTIDSWVKKLDQHLKDETIDVGSNAEDMLTYLMSQSLDIWRRGQKHNVATWVAMAARLDGAREEIESANATNANDYLAPFGLRVRGRGHDAELAIANKPLQGLVQLFDGSRWAGGVWAQATRRIQGAKSANMTFARVASRAYYIPLSEIPGMMSLPMDRPAQAGADAAPATPSELDDFA